MTASLVRLKNSSLFFKIDQIQKELYNAYYTIDRPALRNWLEVLAEMMKDSIPLIPPNN